MDQAVKSIQWALHFGGTGGVGQLPIFQGPPSMGGDVIDMAGGPLQPPIRTNVVESIRTKIENRLRVFLVRRTGPAMVTVTVEGDRVLMRLAAADFFDPGQALIRPQSLPVLDAIAEELAPVGRPVRIEGHTDDTPAAGTQFRDNWELSAARAATVASYLERAHRIAPTLLSATGYAATRPLAEGTSAEARELNRRIELVLELELKAKNGRPGEGLDLAPAPAAKAALAAPAGPGAAADATPGAPSAAPPPPPGAPRPEVPMPAGGARP
jgi:chemotaxis protein MotB